MTKMLASISNVQEALLVLQENIDIIDLKQPAKGALGALEIHEITTIVALVNKRRPLSATIGDLPMNADSIFNAVCTMATTGVDYIKIGFFPDDAWHDTINKLSVLTHQKIALIAVLFADQQPNFKVISALKTAGFTGVMLDTMNKKNGSLRKVMSGDKIENFVTQAKNHHLLCGLAGSLALTDIPELLIHQPDYLGFRGGLCVHNNRIGALDSTAIQRIKYAITRY